MLAVLRRERPLAYGDRAALRAIRVGISGLWCNVGWHHLAGGRRVQAAEAFVHGFLETRDLKFIARALGTFAPWLRQPVAKSLRILRPRPGSDTA